MTLLERVIRAHRCRSTHHFIAFDALSLIGGEQAEGWKSLMLVHHEHLLKGAKAPDDTFKDFKNHVLHISEGEWGGARAKADGAGKNTAKFVGNVYKVSEREVLRCADFATAIDRMKKAGRAPSRKRHVAKAKGVNSSRP